MKARVIKSTGSWYIIENNNNEIFKARLKGKFKLKGLNLTNPIAVGDWIKYEKINEDYIIYEILERNNYIIRRATHNKTKFHLIASNINYTIIFYTINNPATSLIFLDRAIVACESFLITPIIIINKIDIMQKEDLKNAEDLKIMYNKIGYNVFITSIKYEFEKLYVLLDILQNKTSLILGFSGTGKTTFMNKINSELNLKTNDISTYSNRGMHTTSNSQLYNSKKYNLSIIDTPGIKEFEIVNIKRNELCYYFREFINYAKNCEYNNCVHLNEPNCEVKNSLNNNLISLTRYENYLQILNGIK